MKPKRLIKTPSHFDGEASEELTKIQRESVPCVEVEFTDGIKKSITLPSDILDCEDNPYLSFTMLKVGDVVPVRWCNERFYEAKVIAINIGNTSNGSGESLQLNKVAQPTVSKPPAPTNRKPGEDKRKKSAKRKSAEQTTNDDGQDGEEILPPKKRKQKKPLQTSSSNNLIAVAESLMMTELLSDSQTHQQTPSISNTPNKNTQTNPNASTHLLTDNQPQAPSTSHTPSTSSQANLNTPTDSLADDQPQTPSTSHTLTPSQANLHTPSHSLADNQPQTPSTSHTLTPSQANLHTPSHSLADNQPQTPSTSHTLTPSQANLHTPSHSLADNQPQTPSTSHTLTPSQANLHTPSHSLADDQPQTPSTSHTLTPSQANLHTPSHSLADNQPQTPSTSHTPSTFSETHINTPSPSFTVNQPQTPSFSHTHSTPSQAHLNTPSHSFAINQPHTLNTSYPIFQPIPCYPLTHPNTPNHSFGTSYTPFQPSSYTHSQSQVLQNSMQPMSQLLGESLHVVQNLEQDPSNYLRTYNTTGCRNCQLYDEAITQFFGAMRVFSEKISQIKRVPAESSDQLHSENYSPELPDDVQTSSQNCGKNYSPELPDDVQTSSQNGGKRTAFNGRTKEQLRSIRDKFGEFAKASKALLLTMFDKGELEGRSLRGKGPKGQNARPAIEDEGKLEVLYELIEERWEHIRRPSINQKLGEVLKPSAKKTL